MTDPIDYRHQARAVRSAARESLMLLREERMAKRREAEARRDGPGVIRQAEGFISDSACDMTIPEVPLSINRTRPPAQATMPTQSHTEDEKIGASEEDDDLLGPAQVGGSDLEPEAAIEAKATLADPCENNSGDMSSMRTGEPPVGSNDPSEVPVIEVEDAQVTPLDIDTDLSRLPGAGVGLIWMLQRCNIHSLSDLAAADVDALSEKLGLVGQILNVQAWIDFASAEAAG